MPLHRYMIVFIAALTMIGLPAQAETQLRDLTAILVGNHATKREQRAANVLQQHLTRMLGAKLPIVKDASDTKNIIFVGRASAAAGGMINMDEFDGAHIDGFIIRVKNGRVALAGTNDWGTVYAVYTWLEQLGYHFYAPELQVVPKLENTLIADHTTIDQPAIEFRRGIGWQLRGTPPDLIGDPRIPGRELGVKMWIDHTAGLFVPRNQYLKSHPQYYPKRHNGTRGVTRDSDGYVHLCLSNPEVVRLCTERTLQWIGSQQDRVYFFIAQGDGHDWCQCDSCLAMDESQGVYADRLLVWGNHIARAVKEKYPDKVLLMLAYTGSDDPPLREKVESNVIMLYCPYWGINLSMAHHLTHPLNDEALKQFLGWRKVAGKNLGIYDYNLGFCPSWKTMGEKVKWYAKHDVRGIFLLGQPRSFNRLFTYVVARLQWNPEQDVDVLIRNFVEAYYGKAAPYILQYFAVVEEQLAKGYGRGLHDGGHMPAAFHDGPEGEMLLKHLDDALAAAGDDKTLAKRIEKERDLLLKDRKEARAPKRADSAKGEAIVEANRVTLPADAFRGGHYAPKYNWFCSPPKDAVAVYAPRAPRPSSATATFKLDTAPKGELKMVIDGQDSQNDLPPTAQIELRINDTVIHTGDCGFVKQGWSKRTFTIPDGVLREGENTMTLRNTYQGTQRLDGWWFMLANAEISLKPSH